jgi:hypothetical protein
MQTTIQNKIIRIKMNPIAQLNNFIQNKNVTAVTETYKVTQWNEAPGWYHFIEIVYKDHSYVGEGSAKRKQDAKHKACHELLNKIPDASPFVKELLLIGGVETNPGPAIKIPKAIVSYSERNNECKIITGYGLEVQFLKHQLTSTDNYFLVEVDDEKATQLRHLMDNRKYMKISACLPKPDKRSGFSNHIDFQPQKRIIFKHNNRIFDELGLEFPLIESEGVFWKVGNFHMIPRNLLRVNTGTGWIDDQCVDTLIGKHSYCMRSIEKQTMTEKQFVHYAALVTSLQMMYTNVQDDFDSIMKMYSLLYFENIQYIGAIVGHNMDKEKSWDLLQGIEILPIPKPPVYFGKACELVTSYQPHQSKVPKLKFICPQVSELQNLVPEIDWTRKYEDLLEDFKKGKLRDPQLRVQPLKFDFKAVEDTIPKYLRMETENLSNFEKFVRELVLSRLIRRDFDVSVIHALEKVNDPEVGLEVLKVLSKKTFSHYVLVSLQKMLYANISKDPFPDLDSLNSSDFTLRNFYNEILIARRMQLEYQVFAKQFHLRTNANVFNTVENVKRIYHIRHSKVEIVNETYIQKAKNLYNDMKEFLRASYDTKKTMTEINELWQDKKESIKTLLGNKTHMELIDTTDFSSFSSSLSSAKNVINTLFNQLLEWIYAQVGLPFHNDFPASTALLYYLVWKNTDNTTLQYMLLIDILGTIGIVDVALAAIKTVGHILHNMWEKVVPVTAMTEEDLELLLGSMKTQAKENLTDAKKNIESVPEPDITPEDLTVWDKIVHAVNSNNVALIGLVAMGIGTVFKLSSRNYNYDIVGKSIIETMRNLSFVGGGMMMVPKIYQMFISITKWVVDEVKGLVIKDHVTKYDLNRKALDWLKQIAPFISESVVKILPKSPDLCLTWLMLEKEHTNISTRCLDLDKEIRISFTAQGKIFLSRAEKVHVALINMFPADEIFHVQFYSEPGLGKTDLAHGVMESLTRANIAADIDRANTMQGPVAKSLLSNAVFQSSPIVSKYSYNENLKYMDGYVGQTALFVDDTNVFSNTPPENIIQFMYICSGNTVLANMADISEKGRPIDSKIMISNTNNPWLKPQYMADPTALWRRRILVKVRPIPELEDLLKKTTKDPVTEITDFCNSRKLNRSKCEHMLFDILNSTTNNNTIKIQEAGSKSIKLEGLTYSQLGRYLTQNYTMHMSTEWKRSTEKSPIMSKLKMYYTALVQANVEGYAGTRVPDSSNSCMKKGAKIVTDYYNEIVEKLTFKNLEKSNATYELSETDKQEIRDAYIRRKAQELSFINDYNSSINLDEAIKTMLPAQVSGKMTYHELVEAEDVNGKFVYHLIPSETPNCYVVDEANWLHVIKTKIDVAGKEKEVYAYEGSHLDRASQQAVLGLLLDIDSVIPLHRDSYVERKVSKCMTNPIKFSYMQDIKHYLTKVADISSRLGYWIYEKVCKYVGKPLINGVLTMLGLCGLFFTAGVVGSLLAPDPVSYNQQGKKTVIAGVRAPGNRGMLANVSQNSSAFQKVKRSCLKVMVGDNSFQLLAYTANIFIAPAHGFKKVSFPTKIKVADPSVTSEIKEFDLLKSQVRFIPETDYALVHLPGFRPVMSLRSKWISEAELKDDMIELRFVDATIVSIRDRQRNLDTFDGERDFVVQENEKLYVPVDTQCHGMHLGRVLALPYQTVHGDSGSVVIHHNNSLPSSILGIVHQSVVLGRTTYVAILPREVIDIHVKQFEERARVEVCLHEVEEISDHPLRSVFKHNQIMKESPFRSQAVDTAPGFKRTPLFSLFPVDVEPAAQRADDPRFPPNSRHFLEVSLNKSAGVKYVKMTADEERFGEKYLHAIYATFIPEVFNSRVLTTAQAITGIRMQGSTSIDVSTSAGLPYKEERGVIGKTPMIRYDAEGKFWQIQGRVMHDVDLYEQYYSNLKVPQNYKLEFRKHELVGPNKIKEPKTRTVGVGNFIHQIVYMKLFKDLFTMVKNIWMEGRTSPFAMGINPEVHWNNVARHLIYHDYVIDFDVKAWEEKMDQKLMYMATKVRLNILKQALEMNNIPWDPNYERIAYGLVVDYIHSDVVFEDIVYSKTAGLLSGHPGTFMENSEVHEIIFGVVCYSILKKYAPVLANPDYIIENCRSIKAADDIVIAISPHARQYVTAERIVEGYNRIGYEITAPDKSPVVSVKTLYDVQFLKNGFFQNPDMTITVLPNESQIHQLLSYVRTKTALTVEDQMITNFGTAMRFAYHRGEDYYESVRQKLNAACATQRINFVWNADYDDMKVIIEKNHVDEANKFWSKHSANRDDSVFSEEAVYLK